MTRHRQKLPSRICTAKFMPRGVSSKRIQLSGFLKEKSLYFINEYHKNASSFYMVVCTLFATD